MEIKSLKGLHEFLAESAEHLQAFQALQSRSPHEREGAAFAMRIRRWLRNCVSHGRYLPNGSPERRALRALVDEWNSRLSDEGHKLEGVDELASFDPDAGVVLDTDCPYPGLDAYRDDRQYSFEGRDLLSERYVRRLEAHRVLLIIGPSGSGKSSVALAGVRPDLQQLHPDWVFAPEFTPGAAPIAALAQAVAAAAGQPAAAGSTAAALTEKPDERAGAPGGAGRRSADDAGGRSVRGAVHALRRRRAARAVRPRAARLDRSRPRRTAISPATSC